MKKGVVYVPPSREVIQEVARCLSHEMGRPDTEYELANFLQIVTKMKADALNRVAEEPEKV